MNYVGPITFNGARCVIGAVVLLPLTIWRGFSNRKKLVVREKRNIIAGSLLCALFLCVGSTLQQYGIMYTSVGKSGFITSFYIVLVPVIGLFFKKRTRPAVWCAVVIALIGLYLLCINENFSIGIGDILTLACSVMFAGHILVIDYFSPKTDSVTLSCMQFFISGIVLIVCAFIFERPSWAGILEAWKPLLYAGVMSCGVAYTLQIIAQNGLSPSIVSLILSLESCMAVLAGWLVLRQVLSMRELVGCAIMFAAIILVQVPVGKPASAKKKRESGAGL